MSLFVAFKDGSDREYHIGDTEIKYIPAEEVTEVQADGNELEHIQNSFANVPYSKNKTVQNWFGELAKFIVANWQ